MSRAPMPDEELTLTAIVPRGGGECFEYEITCSPKDSGEKLKKRIEKVCHVPTDSMELFSKNQNDKDAKQKWLNEDQTLTMQEVYDGAVITVGVHGMPGGSTLPIEENAEGEVPTDAVQQSIYRKGDTSYYHAHGGKSDLPEGMSVQSGGAPIPFQPEKGAHPLAMAGVDGRTGLVNVVPSTCDDEDEDDTANRQPEKAIINYSWGDEKTVVKIYISADTEPAAIAAAGDGKNGQVEVKWKPRALKLRVHGAGIDYCLALDRIYYDMKLEDCKFRVSEGKRITLTLAKQEHYAWLKLLKPET